MLFISPKTAYITQRFLDEAANADIGVENFSIQELADKNFKIDVNHYDCLYIRFCYPYFEQSIELAKKFIAAGKKVVDANIATGDVGHGKMPIYERLMEANISIPKTEWLTKATQWQYPCIVKWTYGFGGKEVFLVNDVNQLQKTTNLLPQDELLLQEFIPADYEYKIITVGYKALPVILRFEINKEIWRPDFGKADVLHVGQARGLLTDEAGQGPALQQVIGLAQSSSRLLKRELAKVDILQKDDKFYVLEVNRWPGLQSFEELTGYNAVADFVEYIRVK